MIVLNENEWAEEMIKECSLGAKPFETLRRVARYYLDKGYSKSDTKKKMESFLIQCDPSASIPKWENVLDRAFSKAVKKCAINIDSIPVSKTELDIINSINGKPIRRLAFTLLCLAKYWDIANEQNTHWVNTKDSEIKKMANIRTSTARECEMYFKLKELGLIEFSKKVDNLNVKVLFIDDEPPILHITDFRNLGNQYLMHIGEPYYKCQNCGLVTKRENTGKGRRPKYCKECAVKLNIQSIINSVMNQRGIKKNKNCIKKIQCFEE